ncbi:MAG: dephospho-CoA kinase [Chloroflexi bacterium]|nr:dephospho-CoA kinase [Chloroflexota bacterium]
MGARRKRWSNQCLIGLTGNIASGKSSVAQWLARHPLVKALDADLIAHEVLQPDGECHQPVLDHFGRGILQESGGARPAIDRGRLARLVFQDERLLRELEAITHPPIRRILEARISASSEPIIVLEAIKLLESSLRPELDFIWVVNAAEDIRQQRLRTQRKMSAEVARQRIAAQAPQRDKLAQADVVIENGGHWEDTKRQVEAALALVLERLPDPAGESAGTANGMNTV